MKKNIKLWAILIAIAIQSMTTLSVADSIPVSLQQKDPPLIGNNPKPSRGPEIPLSVVYDDVLQELIVENSSIQTIDLGLFDSGTYYLVITYNGSYFGGTFEIID